MKYLRRHILSGVLSALASCLGWAAAAETTVNVVFEGDLKILDPYVTGAYITRNSAYMIFDVLVDRDGKGRYQPQMLESWKASADGLTYDFTLRPELAFHDGAPVTAADCVASINRWWQRNSAGKLLRAHTGSLEATGETTFTLKLAKPFAHVIATLASPIFVMPAKLATTDASKPITEPIGSGPFIFKANEWVPGSKIVYLKNPKYVPRSEPADGLAGGKRVFVDRIEIKSIQDAATTVAAIQRGEVDYVERVPFDLLPLLEQDKSIRISAPLGRANKMGWISLNNGQPPFDNPLIRTAVQYAVGTHEAMDALGIPDGLRQPDCRSFFSCEGPYSSRAAAEAFMKPDPEKAKALLKQAGYKGEKIVSLHTTNIRTIEVPTSIIEEQLKQVGFNIESVPGEWNTVFARYYNNAPIDKGGWSMLVFHVDTPDLQQPLTNFFMSQNCLPNTPGLVCNTEAADYFQKFVSASDPETARNDATGMQLAMHKSANAVLWGQFSIPSAFRTSLSDVIDVGFPVFWSMKKK